MGKSHKNGNTENRDASLEKFLEDASKEMEGLDGEEVDLRRLSREPDHRRLKAMVSDDRMEAHIEAAFPTPDLRSWQKP